MKNLIILLILISVNIGYSQIVPGKWEIVFKLDIRVGNYGTSCYFLGLDSPNKKDIIAFANINWEAPHIITSHDSGKTWQITLRETVDASWAFKINDFAVPDTNLAIAVCDSGSYWRSTDNGRTWNQHFIENRNRIYLVDFWDNKNGIIFQSNYSDSTIVLKTEDGGLNWKLISEPKPVNNIVATSYLYTLGKGIIYSIEVDNKVDSVYYFHKSTDYGETWEEPYKGPKNPPSGNFYFYDENLGFAFGDYGLKIAREGKLIRRTSDGGRTWEEVLRAGMNNNSISGIHFSDSLNGIAASITNIFRTSDGGKSWIEDTTYDYSRDPRISPIFLIDKNNAIGLSTNSDHKVIRFKADNSTYIVDNHYVTNITTFPNPAVNVLNISAPDILPQKLDYSIYTAGGQEVKYGIFSGEELDVSALVPGVYFLLFSSGDKIWYSKFVKE
ncbi:MAG: T9SS type A sorting domain-containing protein [Candidatus Kapabacteria bacterium]|nr:T9SS type A sorting domain-containing protein [Ignavibacteriota bacterium]MCW5886067.1 T9SS type A sorting domain-containing protein [Candidatus Kapabacteria bacterium]